MSVVEENLLKLIDELRKQKATVSFAESCTGGQLSALLTSCAGISDIFMGSVVSYSYQAKEDLLSVDAQTLLADGAVSERVAQQMALGVKRQLKSDWSIAITGIAGPSGGTPTKPVGTVWFSVCGPEIVRSQVQLFSGDRKDIQGASVHFAVDMLLAAILNK